MTQEEKDLLLKDLCSRLPYGVKAKYYGSAEECECCDTIEGIYPMDDEIVIGQYELSIDEIKPYLFPLESMTEEATREFSATLEWIKAKGHSASVMTYDSFDCLNKHHIDYRGLIPMGLAIDATGLNIY